MKTANLFLGFLVITGTVSATPGAADTVTVKFGGTSKMIFLVDNQQDLEELDKYDINGMLKDLSEQMKKNQDSSETTILEDTGGEKYLRSETKQEDTARDEDREYRRENRWRRSNMGTSYRFGADIGLNNYLVEGGKFPDASGALYTVRPLSWNIALNSNWRTHVGGKLFLDWGPNIMWYNYFFQNDNTRIIRNEEGVEFQENVLPLDARYSKLGITYINFSAMPILYLGRASRSRYSGWPCDWCRKVTFRGVRLGLGGYTGYRIDSWSKFAYRDEDGKKRREKVKDNYYLNNFRYGVRFLFGFRGFTAYTNYDLNSLFSQGRGPELNALSFGISF